MIKITVWNLKGGTGKTTTAFNLSANFARAGKKVLCLDLDIQANLTSFFDADISRYKINRPDIREIITGNLELKKGLYTSRFKGLNFIKGSNKPICPGSIMQLSDMLSDMADDTDICITDCHPDNSPISEAALAASDLVLVPILLDGFSRDNLNLVQLELLDIENRTGKEVNYRVVVNRLRNLRSQRSIFHDLTCQHDYPILGTSICDYAGVQSALLAHKPLYLHRRKSQAAQDYADLADELFFTETVKEGC